MERDDAEALRRRLYAPGASDGDVERYRSAEPAPVAATLADAVDDASPAARRRRVPVVPIVLVVLLAILGGVTLARAAADRQPPAIPPTPLAMTASDREDVANDLAAGNGAGIAAFLVTHQSPPSLRTATRFFTLERSGVGNATLDLSGVPAVAFTGRATVLLVLGTAGQATWSTFRSVVEPDGTVRDVEQRRRGGQLQADQLTADTYRYGSGDRPVQLRVQAPDGVRWGAAVVYSD